MLGSKSAKQQTGKIYKTQVLGRVFVVAFWVPEPWSFEFLNFVDNSDLSINYNLFNIYMATYQLHVKMTSTL